MPSPTLVSQAHKAAFVDMLAGGRSVSAAARALGVARSTMHWHRRHDLAFASAWNAATELRDEVPLFLDDGTGGLALDDDFEPIAMTVQAA